MNKELAEYYLAEASGSPDLEAVGSRSAAFAQAAVHYSKSAASENAEVILDVLYDLYDSKKANFRREAVQVMGECADLLRPKGDRVAARVCSWYGVFLKEVNRFAEAEAELKRAFAMFERLGMKLQQLGARINILNVLQGQGKLNEARTEGREALLMADAMMPDADSDTQNTLAGLKFQALENLALVEERGKEYNQAIEYANQALEIDEKSLTAIVSLGNAHLGLDQIDEAAKEIDKALKLVNDWNDDYAPVVAELIGYYCAKRDRHCDALAAWAYAAKIRKVTNDEIEDVDLKEHLTRWGSSRDELKGVEGEAALETAGQRGESLTWEGLAELVRPKQN